MEFPPTKDHEEINDHMLISKVINDCKPEFNSKFLERFATSKKVDQRPNFNLILNLLKNDGSFITEKVN